MSYCVMVVILSGRQNSVTWFGNAILGLSMSGHLASITGLIIVVCPLFAFDIATSISLVEAPIIVK